MKDIADILDYLRDLKATLDGGATITKDSLVSQGLNIAIAKAVATKNRVVEAQEIFKSITDLADDFDALQKVPPVQQTPPPISKGLQDAADGMFEAIASISRPKSRKQTGYTDYLTGQEIKVGDVIDCDLGSEDTKGLPHRGEVIEKNGSFWTKNHGGETPFLCHRPNSRVIIGNVIDNPDLV